MLQKLSVVIGMPRVLPKESRYTASAQSWADREACAQVVEKLKTAMPHAVVHVGITDVSEPDVRLNVTHGSLAAREATAVAKKAAEASIRDVRMRIEGNSTPEKLTIQRSLEVTEIEAYGRVTEHRLVLRELSNSQCAALADRGWIITGSAAAISMPVEAYEREREWLLKHDVI